MAVASGLEKSKAKDIISLGVECSKNKVKVSVCIQECETGSFVMSN